MRPLDTGGAAGHTPPLREMLDAYYEERGWDAEVGGPPQARIESMGLGDETDYAIPWS